MQIISVPAVYSLKLPGGEWLNLALVRRLQFESEPPVAIVTWSNGDSQLYNGDQAVAIAQAWEEAPTKIDRSNSIEREVLEVLRRRGGEMSVLDLVKFFPDCFFALDGLRARRIIAFRDGGVVLSEIPSVSLTREDVVTQLLAFGATDALIEAFLESNDLQIELAIATIEDRDKRDRLTEIVQRLGVVQGRER